MAATGTRSVQRSCGRSITRFNTDTFGVGEKKSCLCVLLVLNNFIFRRSCVRWRAPFEVATGKKEYSSGESNPGPICVSLASTCVLLRFIAWEAMMLPLHHYCRCNLITTAAVDCGGMVNTFRPENKIIVKVSTLAISDQLMCTVAVTSSLPSQSDYGVHDERLRYRWFRVLS